MKPNYMKDARYQYLASLAERAKIEIVYQEIYHDRPIRRFAIPDRTDGKLSIYMPDKDEVFLSCDDDALEALATGIASILCIDLASDQEGHINFGNMIAANTVDTIASALVELASRSI